MKIRALVLVLALAGCGSSHDADVGMAFDTTGFDTAPVPLFEECATDFAVLTVGEEPGCQSVPIQNVGSGFCNGFGTRPMWDGVSALLVNPTERTWAYYLESAEEETFRRGSILGDVIDGRGCGICDTVEEGPAIGSGGNISVSTYRLVFDAVVAEGETPLVLHVCSPEDLRPDLVYSR